MADPKSTPSKLYQPTPEEIANVYNRMNGTLKADYYERARQILQDVNKNFIFDLGYGWFVRSSSQPGINYGVDTRWEPPVCHCASYWSDPAAPNPPHIYLPKPNGGKLLRRQCKHTIAYMAYRTILAQHFELFRNHVPPFIKPAMYNGVHQPADALALNRFACWLPLYLADPVKVAAISAELRRPFVLQ